MDQQLLETNARRLVAEGKGILAADESSTKPFASKVMMRSALPGCFRKKA